MGMPDGSRPVAQKQANAWGLYDMSGNIGEWVWDLYGAYPASATDPRGPDSGSDRIIRGGHHLGVATAERSANRQAMGPDTRTHYYGFRLARTFF